MKRVLSWLQVLLLPVFVTSAAQAGDFKEGTQYLRLAKPQATTVQDKIEVVELFWYGCPHCYKLEPYIKDWAANKPDDVEFIRMPAILGPGWELFAKGYFTADILGVLDTIHPALFAEIHDRRSRINTPEKLRAFFLNNGVKAEDFDKTFKSFAVAVKVNNARLMTQRYAITGVPTLIVNGKFSTSASIAGGNPKMIQGINHLVDQERKLAGATAKPAATVTSQ